MELSTQYCSHCLQKFCPEETQAIDGKLFFFIPTIDALDRPFYLYVAMPADNARRLFSHKQVVDIRTHAEILHVEEGEWPSHARQIELHAFYAPAIQYFDTISQQRLAA